MHLLVTGTGRVDLVGLDQRLSVVDEVKELLEQLRPADDTSARNLDAIHPR